MQIPGSGRSPGGGHGNPLQYSCLENPMDRGAWRATYSPWGHKSRTQLSDSHFHLYRCNSLLVLLISILSFFLLQTEFLMLQDTGLPWRLHFPAHLNMQTTMWLTVGQFETRAWPLRVMPFKREIICPQLPLFPSFCILECGPGNAKPVLTRPSRVS